MRKAAKDMSSSWAEHWWGDVSRSSRDGCGLGGDDDKEGNDAGGNTGTTVQTTRTKQTSDEWTGLRVDEDKEDTHRSPVRGTDNVVLLLSWVVKAR